MRRKHPPIEQMCTSRAKLSVGKRRNSSFTLSVLASKLTSTLRSASMFGFEHQQCGFL